GVSLKFRCISSHWVSSFIPRADTLSNLSRQVQSVWVTQWDVLQGNRRAVAGRELQLSEPPDPEHAELMQQLAETLAGQARDVLVNYY
ncbi:hypothetical protein, partial [Pelagicoccus sp. SDUM812002]|uniref:hypothetical protein n=1 Tax=Pelagicoccus sp. SDUM812002 TaxID=3041266 RepID=UPI00280DA907